MWWLGWFQVEAHLSPIWPSATPGLFLWVISIRPRTSAEGHHPGHTFVLPQQLPVHLFPQNNATLGSRLSPGEGGGKDFLTHSQVTPFPPTHARFTPCSPVPACLSLFSSAHNSAILKEQAFCTFCIISVFIFLFQHRIPTF